MTKNWKTSLFGSLATFGGTLLASGVHIGHVGNVDALTATTAIFGLLFSFYSKDRNVTGGTVQQ